MGPLAFARCAQDDMLAAPPPDAGTARGRAPGEGWPGAATRATDGPSLKLCLRRQSAGQTVHPATASWPFRLFFVVGGTVWRARCRRRHSLGQGLSPQAQFGSHAVVRCTVRPAGAGRIDRRRQRETRLYRRRQLGPDFAPFVSPARQSGRWAVAGTSVWQVGCRQRHSLARAVSPDAQSDVPLVIPRHSGQSATSGWARDSRGQPAPFGARGIPRLRSRSLAPLGMTWGRSRSFAPLGMTWGRLPSARSARDDTLPHAHARSA